MDEEELIALLMSLPPEEQAIVLQQLGLDTANEAPYSFGDMAPELSGPEFDLTGFGAGFPADYNSKGEALPFGLDQQGQVLTQQKNYNALLADNITGAMAGPGAYGPEAFVPREVYGGDPLEQQGQQMAAYYSSLGGGGFQSLVADEILNGTDPATAVSKVLQLAQMPDSESLSPEMRAQREAILASLPPARVGGGGPQVPSQQGDRTPAQEFAQRYDVQSVYDFANELGSTLARDPQDGYRDPATGILYAEPPKQEWSGAAQKYMDLGLPFPTDNYTDEKYLELMAPLDREGNAAAIAQAQQQAQQASQAAMPWADINEMEKLLAASEASKRNESYLATPVAGQMTAWNSEGGVQSTSPRLGPVNARAANPADQFRTRAAEPLFFQRGSGDFAFGSADELPDVPFMDFQGTLNRELARAGAQTPKAGKVTKDTVKKGKAQQSQAYKARSSAMDARIGAAKTEQDRAFAMGQAQSMASQGRTPLTDAMLKRLLAQRNQGLYG